ncbi:MAG: hypothetical protein J6B44_01850 [Muribaculaceae bacterium]|nr:hypothetical protein [Muribaculaceae bacterium]
MKIIKFISRKTISDNDARRLTGLFLDGATSPDEERQLYAYYSRHRVAADLARYQSMFSWYETLAAEPAKKSGNRHRNLAAAATVAVLLTTGWMVIDFLRAGNSNFDACDLYAGSYIIRNGQKITDIDKIMPELQNADRLTDSVLCAAEIDKCEDIELLTIDDEFSSISNPEVRAFLLNDTY